MKKSVLYTISAAFALLAVSCGTDETTSVNSTEDLRLLTAGNVSDMAMEADFQSGMDAAADDSSLSSRVACASVTVSGTTFPKTYTIDFGTGCTNNGITRSGVITVTLSDYFFANGTIITVQRNNYHINGYKVEGTVTFTNITTGNDVPQWTRTIANGQVTTPDDYVYQHSGTRTVRQIGGANTSTVLIDNIYEVISGSHTVTGPGGSTLSASIAEPLIKKYTCAHISKGVLNLQGSWLDGDLDYGNDTCDNQAIYTHSNGTPYNVTLY